MKCLFCISLALAAFNLDFYTDVQDLSYLQNEISQDPRSAKYRCFNLPFRTHCQMIADFSSTLLNSCRHNITHCRYFVVSDCSNQTRTEILVNLVAGVRFSIYSTSLMSK